MKEKQIVFSDHIGRTISGIVIAENDNTITVRNPVIVHVEPQQSGQLSVHTYPYLFMEVIDEASREVNDWTFNKNNIAVSSINLEPRLGEAVANVNKPKPVIATPGDSKIVNLFDEE